MRPWSIEECEAYAQQLRDKSKANTAEHAAQAIEYLLGLVRRQWQGLTDEEVSEIINREIGFNSCWGPEEKFARAIEQALKEKNT